MMTIGCLHSVTQEERIIELLKKSTPLTIEDISLKLHIEKDTVSHIVHFFQESNVLCVRNGLVYTPKSEMKYWLVAWLVIAVCTFVTCSLIKLLNL